MINILDDITALLDTMEPERLKTLATYTLEEALKLLDTDKPYIDLHRHRVKVSNQRYELFRLNNVCVWCREPGTIMKLQAFHQSTVAHFNLFNSKDVFYTKDHIMPKSKGGPDLMWNYQTMCRTCNAEKADCLPSTSRFLNPHTPYSLRELEEEQFMEDHFRKK